MNTSTVTLTAPSTPILFAAASFAPDDPRAVFARAVTLTSTVIAAVRPEHLDRPTPCDDFDVAALLRHMAALLPRVAAIGRAEAIAGSAQADGDIAIHEWSARWLEGACEVEAVWADDAVLSQTVVLPWVTESGAEALAGYTNEVTVHTWDLATAIGVAPAWDHDVLEVSFGSISHGLPAVGRLEMFAKVMANVPAQFRGDPPFADAVETAGDAPLIDRLVAWNGRHPQVAGTDR